MPLSSIKNAPIEGRGAASFPQVGPIESVSWMRRRPRPSWCRSRTRDVEPGLPPVLAGRATPAVERQVGSFYASVAEVFERWVARRESKHTRRAYRQDVMAFVAALGLRWPDDAMRLFTVSVADVQDFRDRMIADGKAPQDDQPPHRLALELLQVPPGGRLGVPPADHRARTRRTPSSSPAARPTRATRRRPSRPPGPGSSWGCPRAIRSSTIGTARSSSSSSTAGSGSAPAAGSR